MRNQTQRFLTSKMNSSEGFVRSVCFQSDQQSKMQQVVLTCKETTGSLIVPVIRSMISRFFMVRGRGNPNHASTIFIRTSWLQILYHSAWLGMERGRNQTSHFRNQAQNLETGTMLSTIPFWILISTETQKLDKGERIRHAVSRTHEMGLPRLTDLAN